MALEVDYNALQCNTIQLHPLIFVPLLMQQGRAAEMKTCPGSLEELWLKQGSLHLPAVRGWSRYFSGRGQQISKGKRKGTGARWLICSLSASALRYKVDIGHYLPSHYCCPCGTMHRRSLNDPEHPDSGSFPLSLQHIKWLDSLIKACCMHIN